jgi:hypothetical protein
MELIKQQSKLGFELNFLINFSSYYSTILLHVMYIKTQTQIIHIIILYLLILHSVYWNFK